MGDFSVLITPPGSAPSDMQIAFQTPDLPTSLIVAEMNLERGTAELFVHGKPIALLRKTGEAGRPVWLVNPR